MKYLLLLTAFTLLSCQEKKDDNYTFLYEKVEMFTRHANLRLDAQKFGYKEYHINEPSNLIKYDSIDRIDRMIQQTLKKLNFSDRKRTLKIRDSIIKKLRIPVSFKNEAEYENLNYSVFQKMIEVDFLTIRETYLGIYLFRHER